MKPIALTLKGINSFIEEQTIDFESLTSAGIFGIFGPTGSGKSTILDGITLALYGEISRESKNFIHVGCDTASVSFTFSITEKDTKIYRVSRSFKIKKDTGYSVAAKARLTQLLNDTAKEQGSEKNESENELVLEDSISGVKARIHQIVGLEFDDFTRTVVLPQGKFSEFLKLSGNSRNQMLERLFHLYDYGIALTEKIKRRSMETELLYNTCLGKLAEHAGESKEALEEVSTVLKSAKNALKRQLQEQKENDEKYRSYRELWEWQEEMKGCKQILRELSERSREMEEAKVAVQNAGKAALVKPYYDQYQRIAGEYRQTVTDGVSEGAKLYTRKEELVLLEQEAQRIVEKKRELEDGYQEKVRKLQNAIELEKQITDTQQQVDDLEEQFKKQKKKVEVIDEKVQCAREILAEKKSTLEQCEKRFLEQMEEQVTELLRMKWQQEGVCPICGTVHEVPDKSLMEHAGEHQSKDRRYEDGMEEFLSQERINLLKQEVAGLEANLSAMQQEQLDVKTVCSSVEASLQAVSIAKNNQLQGLKELFEECGITQGPKEHKEYLEAAYQHITKEQEACEQRLDIKRESVRTQELLVAKLQAKEEEQKQKLTEAETLLGQKLQEHGIESEEALLTYSLEQEQIQRLEQKIRTYEERYIQITKQIEILEARIGNRYLEQDVYEQVCRKQRELEESICTLREDIAVYTERRKKLEETLTIVAGLLEEKKHLEHQKAILAELASLLKGKRFVEYVARERLSYVAGEASEKLMEITGGIYGLELRENGEFSVRDYKNGGIERNVNSLSGGELFLVSLSLALALSTQIQLKGTAPLEFFFLDEGFGTLDDNLLDVVMDSLDKLHHERRKIGIISHVDAIKERVPVKLIVTPAKAGEGGSKVEIVRS